MAKIHLTQGKVALVDDEDLCRLMQHNWNARQSKKTWYAQTNIWVEGKRTVRKMHRMVLSADPGQQVDHINGDGLDNRRGNLRLCSNAENCRNRSKRVDNKSGFKGVCWAKDRGMWIASIRSGAVRVRLGQFACPIEAAIVRDAKARELHGEFASLNFPYAFRLVVVESRYAGDVDTNMRYARAVMRDCLLRGEAPYLSHALYTQPGVLDDNIPSERKLGMEAGFVFHRVAHYTAVYTDLGISEGMKAGIKDAKSCGNPVTYRTLGPHWKDSLDMTHYEEEE